MTKKQNDCGIHQAEARIKIAILRLAAKYPFHARVLEQFHLCVSPEMATMGVGVSESGQELLLYYSPAFVNRILLSELVGVTLHEVHHVVLGHIYQDPSEYADQWARMVAEEVTVNEFVNEPLPGEPITVKLFTELSPLQSTDQRYNILKRRTERNGVQLSPENMSTTSEDVPRLVDDHSLRLNSAGIDEVQAIVREVLEVAAGKSATDEIPAVVLDALSAQGIGTRSGDGIYKLKHETKGQIPWQRLLKRYVGKLLAADHAIHRPNRRFPELVGVIPGKIRVTGKPKILAVIDSSGSITTMMLELIDAELARLAKDYSITVAECDCVIHKVFPYSPLKTVLGRGGTDLRPPFEKRFLRKHRPDLIVYFTDGMGPAPKHPPKQPVIWCLVAGSSPPAKWGRVILCNQCQQQVEKTQSVTFYVASR